MIRTRKPLRTGEAIPFDFLLSDEIGRMRTAFAAHEGGPVTMDAPSLNEFIGALAAWKRMAREMENEISRLTWNLRGSEDISAAELAGAIEASGGRVVALAFPERPFGAELTRYPGDDTC